MGTPATAHAGYRALLQDADAFATIEDNAYTALQDAKDAVRRAEEALNHVPSSQAAQTRLARTRLVVCQQHLAEVRKLIRATRIACQNAGMGLAVIVYEDSPLQREISQHELQQEISQHELQREIPQHEMRLDRLWDVWDVSIGLQQPVRNPTRPENIPRLPDDASSSSADSEDLR